MNIFRQSLSGCLFCVVSTDSFRILGTSLYSPIFARCSRWVSYFWHFTKMSITPLERGSALLPFDVTMLTLIMQNTENIGFHRKIGYEWVVCSSFSITCGLPVVIWSNIFLVINKKWYFAYSIQNQFGLFLSKDKLNLILDAGQLDTCDNYCSVTYLRVF